MERHVTINGTEFWIDPENLLVKVNGKTYEIDRAYWNKKHKCYAFGLKGTKIALGIRDRALYQRVRRALEREVLRAIENRFSLIDPDEARFRKGLEFDWRRG